jgi:hypothetical protein
LARFSVHLAVSKTLAMSIAFEAFTVASVCARRAAVFFRGQHPKRPLSNLCHCKHAFTALVVTKLADLPVEARQFGYLYRYNQSSDSLWNHCFGLRQCLLPSSVIVAVNSLPIACGK